MHGVRDEIFPSGQYFTHRTDLRGHVFDAVNDLSVFRAEDDVAVFSHDLHDEHLAAEVAQFIQVLDGKADDALQLRL